MFSDRVLSGMRPTGRMHIGHYHGALKNWLRLQEEYECLYFAADWHALTTHYETPERIEDSVWEMFIDWLAVGINPSRSTIFIQSRVVEHAELTLLLGMIAPVGWLCAGVAKALTDAGTSFPSSSTRARGASRWSCSPVGPAGGNRTAAP